MKPNSRRVRVVSTALTDPQPSFVSLVGHGANQKPWQSVKADRAVIEIKSEELAMQIETLKSAGWEVVNVAFDTAKFTVEAAKAWLEAGGYQAELVEDGGVLSTKETETSFTNIRVIKTDNGVSVMVGQKSGQDEPPAQEVIAEAKAENETEAKPETQTKDDNQPELPLEELTAKFWEKLIEAAKATPISDDRKKGLYSAINLHDVVISLKWLVDDMEIDLFFGAAPTDSESAIIGTIKSAASQLVSALAAMFQMEAERLVDAFKAAKAEVEAAKAAAKSEDAPKDEPAEAAPDKEEAKVEAPKEDAAPTAEPEAPADASTKGEKNDDPVAAAIKAAVEQITQSVQGLAGTVTDVAEKVATLGTRLDQVEKSAGTQTRKSADVEDTTTGSTPPASKKADNLRELTLRGAMGVGRPRTR